jgi:N-acylglucosamine 2-epimerase
MLKFVDPDRKLVRENVLPDGSPHNSPEGRILNPGHSIEAGWFLHHWAMHLNRDDLAETARNMIRWSFDRGWDDEYGGIFYFLDTEGYSPLQLEWPMKLWWPHTEAIYATLVCYLKSGGSDDLDRLRRVDRYIREHLVDPEHGEWFGYLDREGRVSQRFKGGPYKGCFHVPRALWLSISAIDRHLDR